MAQLSDLQLANLLDEIACVMRSSTSLVESMRRLERNRLGRVGRTAGQIADRLERGESMSTAFAIQDNASMVPFSACIAASERAHHPEIVARTAKQLRRRAEYTRNLRLAWFYPLLLMAVGYIVGVFFLAPVVRNNHSQSEIFWPQWVVSLSFWLADHWMWPLVILAIFGFCAYALSRLRNRFPRSIRLGLFCSELADQIEHDVPENVAIASAAELSGDRALRSIPSPSLESDAIKQILSQAPFPARGIEGVNQKTLLVSALRYLGALYVERSRRHVYFWTRWIPKFFMAVMGGGLALAYAWWVIGPVYRQVVSW